MLICRNQSIDLHSKLLYWLLHYCTDLKMLGSIQQRMQLHICFLYVMHHVEFVKISVSFHDFFSPHAQNLKIIENIFFIKNPINLEKC